MLFPGYIVIYISQQLTNKKMPDFQQVKANIRFSFVLFLSDVWKNIVKTITGL